MNLKEWWSHLSTMRVFPMQRVAEVFVRGRHPGDIFILASLIALCFISLLFVLNGLYMSVTEEVPARGGSLKEGIVGTPRFANPLLAISDADRDIVELIYAGLMTVDSSGAFIPELASHYTISSDNLSYTFTIKDSAYFTDGTPVTADDVAFTVSKAQDSVLKSTKRASWEGVSTEIIDDKTITFHLKEPYSPFLENTTLGILPKHIWEQVTSEEFPFTQFALEPIGAGPYEIQNISRNGAGVIRSYTLKANSEYVLGTPYLSTLTLSFYPNTEALAKAVDHGDVESAHSIAPANGKNPAFEEPYSRVFGIFFNQNKNAVLKDLGVRQALDTAIDRTRIVNEVMGGYGTPLVGPLPSSYETNTASHAENIASAKEILIADKWTWSDEVRAWRKGAKNEQTLTITLKTGNTRELSDAAKIVKENWEELGAQVSLELYEASDLQQNVLRGREYEAVYFGLIIPREPDMFAFWHSSQRNDPGLNISLYTNSVVDDLLSKIRKTSEQDEREALSLKFETEIKNDVPAIFTHTPNFVYLAPTDLHGLPHTDIVVPSDRFTNVQEWYRTTERVWPIFIKTNN